MGNSSNQLNRLSHRYYGYDYSQEGLYFITICTKNKEHLFGQVVNEEVCLSEIGKVVNEYWLKIVEYHPYVVLHEFVIMPNHLHGIIEIVKKEDIVDERIYSCKKEFVSPSKTIGSVIRGFKGGVTSSINKNMEPKQIWQSNYYDHIIRDYESYISIKKYILDNPRKWNKKELNIW